ncbi:MAG: potassium transporter [Pseudarthrobacter sp.]|nr:potassium transporter [Pseudarthrobacter sp.]
MTSPQLPEPHSGSGHRSPEPSGPHPSSPEPSPAEPSPTAGLAADYAAKAGLHRTHDGRIDVLKTAGGVQGIAESIVPGLLFLVAFTITRDLTLALVAALASAAAFTVARLIQRRPLTQALAGVVGVGISAWLANTTGKAEDFYLPGFFTNAAYIVAMVISIAIKWPVAGLLFGFIRNEGLDWRKDPARLKAYRLGTWVIVAVLVLRLVVQVPLYLMGEDGLAALATTRLIMAAPLYILGVWVAWLITRPAPADADAQPSKPSSSGA